MNVADPTFETSGKPSFRMAFALSSPGNGQPEVPPTEFHPPFPLSLLRAVIAAAVAVICAVSPFFFQDKRIVNFPSCIIGLVLQTIFIHADHLKQLTACSGFIHDVLARIVCFVEFRAADRDHIDRVNDRLNRASQDRRNGATQKAPKTISDDPFKSVCFASFF